MSNDLKTIQWHFKCSSTIKWYLHFRISFGDIWNYSKSSRRHWKRNEVHQVAVQDKKLAPNLPLNDTPWLPKKVWKMNLDHVSARIFWGFSKNEIHDFWGGEKKNWRRVSAVKNKVICWVRFLMSPVAKPCETRPIRLVWILRVLSSPSNHPNKL